MSYVTSFMDGEKYGAQDINKVVSRFVHSGVEEAFVDGEPYNVRRLNDLSKPVTTRGVIGSESTALAVEKIGDSYYISPGTAFFGNGSTLEVTSNEPITLSNTSAVNYVYLVSNEDENRNYIQVSTVEPELSDENIVMLAEISSDGAVTDRRCYATGKLRGMYQDNEFTLKSIRIQDFVEFSENQNEVNIIHDLGCSNFNIMVFALWDYVDENGDYFPRYISGGRKYTQNDLNILAVWFPKEERTIIIKLGREDIDNLNAWWDPVAYGSIADTNSYDSTNFKLAKNSFPFKLSNHYYSDILQFEISRISGNNWNFRYYTKSPHITLKHTTDFKLYYI